MAQRGGFRFAPRGIVEPTMNGHSALTARGAVDPLEKKNHLTLVDVRFEKFISRIPRHLVEPMSFLWMEYMRLNMANELRWLENIAHLSASVDGKGRDEITRAIIAETEQKRSIDAAVKLGTNKEREKEVEPRVGR